MYENNLFSKKRQKEKYVKTVFKISEINNLCFLPTIRYLEIIFDYFSSFPVIYNPNKKVVWQILLFLL